MTMTKAMACKAITRRTAEWIGYAAMVAGGYITVDGPRIERISRDEYRAIREDAENDTVRWRREDARRLAAAYHKLPSGDYARVLPYRSWDADFVMVVPADHPLAQHGYSLPASLVRELIPALQAAGYDTAGLLGETSGEGAEEPPKIEVLGLGADDWGAEADPWETEEERRRREAAREWERYGTVRVQVGDVVYDVGCAIGVPEYLRATAEAAGGDTTRPAYLAAWYVDASDWSLARGSDGSEGVPPELAGAVLGAISDAVVCLWREYQEERADYSAED